MVLTSWPSAQIYSDKENLSDSKSTVASPPSASEIICHNHYMDEEVRLLMNTDSGLTDRVHSQETTVWRFFLENEHVRMSPMSEKMCCWMPFWFISVRRCEPYISVAVGSYYDRPADQVCGHVKIKDMVIKALLPA